MRKWRPAERCIYVIPEICGELESLKVIFDRILPLRYRANQFDKVILLGDYVGPGIASSGVLDLVIEAQRAYPDSFHCLLGDRDQDFLFGLESEEKYREWVMHGGFSVIKSYLAPDSASSPLDIAFGRVPDFIPPSHIRFLQNLPKHLIFGNHLLCHGGVNLEDVENTTDEVFVRDSKSSFLIKKNPLMWQSFLTVVTAHNYKAKFPCILPHYFMLGGSAPRQLILFELNSLLCSKIKRGKSRFYRHYFKSSALTV